MNGAPKHSRSAEGPRPLRRFGKVRWSGTRARKLRAMAEWFRQQGSALVAYSGGVDSTLLAAVAHDVLLDRAVAVTLDSPTLPRAELEEACEFARRIGIRHVVVPLQELENDAFVANSPERCYVCKTGRCRLLCDLARRWGLAVVADGSNVDDRSDFRPGARAADEWRIARPFQCFGLTKAEIRSASRTLGLPTADKPAAACLASRLPYGTPITAEALARIEASETALQALGFLHCRVRLHGDAARIELAPCAMFEAIRRRAEIVERLQNAGNHQVLLDLRGYRTGSLNEGLGLDAPRKQRKRTAKKKGEK